MSTRPVVADINIKCTQKETAANTLVYKGACANRIIMLMKKSYTHYGDRELVNLLRKNDDVAFAVIYERYWQQIYNSTYKRLADHEVAADMVQEIFCDLWARRGNTDIDELAPYLHQAVKFQVYKFFRKGRSSSRFFELFDRLIQTPTADVPLLEKELHVKFQAWLDKLPSKKRRIFEMHHDEGKTPSEIARAVNVSTKTVQNQLSLTKLDLKAELSSLSLLILTFWV